MKNLKIYFCAIFALCAASPPLSFAEESANSILKPLTEEQEKAKAAGEALAQKIMSGTPRFSIIGQLEQDSGGTFRINGEAVRISKDTRIEGTLTIGASVSANGFVENGVRVARVVRISSGAVVESNAAPSSEPLRADFNSEKK